MSRERSKPVAAAEHHGELDRRLEAVLEADGETGVATARAAVLACPDRWYGRLVALAHDAAANAPAPDAVRSAGAAVELLRGYCRLRSGLFARLHDGTAASPTDALLAGDYLNSAAYTALVAADHARAGDAFDALLAVSESLYEGFDTSDARFAADAVSFLDETAGTLGEGAAVVGAALAGADESLRARLGEFGREFGTARQVRRVLASDGGSPAVAPREFDEQRLRQHGEQRRGAGEQVLERLSTEVDVGALRAFVDVE